MTDPNKTLLPENGATPTHKQVVTSITTAKEDVQTTLEHQDTENRKSFLKRLEGKVPDGELMKIEFAYDMAKSAHAHKGATRDDGKTRYFEHPRQGCLVLMDELGCYDPKLLISFLFHDVGEDTPLLGNILEDYHAWVKNATFRLNQLYANTAPIVIALTKPAIDQKTFFSKEEVYEYYFSQLRSNENALLLKMVDRLINLRDMKSCTPEKIIKQLKETEEKYLPMFRSFIENTPNEEYKIMGRKLLEKISERMEILSQGLTQNH
ncbi:MAG: hypothetical protein LBD11_08845 [Candidatus Peribacteria bacterium]|jgi:(p)ppGpp synthase/HD superfamily hydrolase|nr:hypothetical protein [Candidatus Peribacteria bacterium]